jgi:hypothetical protein
MVNYTKGNEMTVQLSTGRTIIVGRHSYSKPLQAGDRQLTRAEKVEAWKLVDAYRRGN